MYRYYTLDVKCTHALGNDRTLLWTVSGQRWATTATSHFLVYDNGAAANVRVTVFGTESGLQLLGRSAQWYMDGNFAMAPAIFSQLYVIRVSLGDSAVTCVYALLGGKTTATYEEMLRGVSAKCDSLGCSADPQKVVADFEPVR